MITRILIIGIPPSEINVIKNELDASGFQYVEKFIDAIDDWKSSYEIFQPHILIIGYEYIETLSISTFNWCKNTSKIPLMCFAGAVGEENAVNLIKRGVDDIIFINNITALVPKIRSALEFEPTITKPGITASSDLHLLCKEEFITNAILENCMEGIFLTIPDGRILSANPAACEIFGLTEADLIAKGRLDIVDFSDPNLEILLAERHTKGKARGELRMVRGDGTIFPTILSSAIFPGSSGEPRSVIIIRDISNSRNSEQQLIKTKNELAEAFGQLNKTIEASQDIICSFDYQGRFVSVNAACESIWGYPAEELIGTFYFDLVLPEDRIITSQTDQTIKDGNPVTVFENRYVHKSGRVAYMLWSAIWDETEELMYCIAKDISEKKRLEKTCEIERKRFLDLYELAPCCLGILKGPDHIFEMANPLYLQLINRGPDIIGKSVMEVLPELKSQGIFELLDDVYHTGKSFVANEMLLQFDTYNTSALRDSYLNFMYMPHRNNEGDIDGILFFAIDVTEQVVSRLKIEESEKLYRNLIMELPVAAYSCDAEGKIAIYNKAAANLWGREPEIGKEMWCGSWNLLTSKGKRISHEKSPMAIALKEGTTVSGRELIIERENGERRNIYPHAVPYFNTSQQVIGAVTMLTDVTDTKMAEISLLQQNRELLKANKELDRFVYSVSHDLRSPLTSIFGLASFIEDESNEPDTVMHIKMIKNSINRLDGFIRKILSYSQNNRTGLDIEPIIIKEKVERIVYSLKNMSVGQHIDYQIDIVEDYPFGSDRARFNAIIENLLSNAIKYRNPDTPNKYIKIVGRVSKKAFQFTISDNGIGIPPEYHEKIFEMFFRISGNSEGSGIGLYIVKDMVERLGGTIKVSSQKGGVTKFDVVLKNFLLCQD